jgi:hypothetical protein
LGVRRKIGVLSQEDATNPLIHGTQPLVTREGRPVAPVPWVNFKAHGFNFFIYSRLGQAKQKGQTILAANELGGFFTCDAL